MNEPYYKFLKTPSMRTGKIDLEPMLQIELLCFFFQGITYITHSVFRTRNSNDTSESPILHYIFYTKTSRVRYNAEFYQEFLEGDIIILFGKVFEIKSVHLSNNYVYEEFLSRNQEDSLLESRIIVIIPAVSEIQKKLIYK